ncbi:nucleotidyl transferase AbiEii/AbiGii toxin family protein [Brevibacterium gallinarum]|uniref:Nucleotidyl transferase AbiEii/AbiGii toxin family protein n=1 Tax=Brevibacterium gallinarum TaxID=2762220 RepID=A0ABR8WX12_9MICO|nr:nucleotidyl transferase AbiEii/AbiGii toxin family protein [Brevibacterium gallinarum]MBD8021540.1 nucleotidyl transferase AbiEii/AbiGii toxin family protein [Brevibacterium gallinarum]
MTPPTPSRDTPAGRAYNDLRNLARRQNRDPAEYITLYALEGFLARLASSESATDFVLKGGVLMAAFADRRPTRDIDFAARGFTNDIPEVERRVMSILAVRRDDGLEFDLDSVNGERIRDEADYNGVRVKVTAQLATAQVALHIDVNFGDPIWPAPAEAVLPLLLGGTLHLLGYPDHMVLAEKIVTALERGEQNTRWRDFTDIAAIARSRVVSGADLQEAIGVVARYRQVELEPLGPLLSQMPAFAQRKWQVWRKKQRIEQSTPVRFEDLLATCLDFVEPVLAGNTDRLHWNFSSQAWEEPTSASVERALNSSSSLIEGEKTSERTGTDSAENGYR